MMWPDELMRPHRSHIVDLSWVEGQPGKVHAEVPNSDNNIMLTDVAAHLERQHSSSTSYFQSSSSVWCRLFDRGRTSLYDRGLPG